MSISTERRGGGDDTVARRARLGFAMLPPAHVRLDLIHPEAPVRRLVPYQRAQIRRADPDPPRPLLTRYGWPPYCQVVFYDTFTDRQERPKKSCMQIVREVAENYSVTVNDILSPRRSRNIVAARHAAFWRCKMETTMGLPQIGRRIGGKDHTTVLHGLRQHERRMKEAMLSTGQGVDKSRDLLVPMTRAVFIEDRPTEETIDG